MQRRESRSQYRHLPFRIIRLTERSSQRIFDGGDARRADRLNNFRNRRKDDGRKTSRFDLALYQSNGPVADRSGRDEYNHIRMIGSQVADDGRDSLLQQLIRIQDISHD